MSLTKHDVKALKHADYIVFYFEEAREMSEIVAGRRGENTSSGFEERHHINVESRRQSYGKRKVSKAITSVNTSYNPEWETLVCHLREGDDIALRWIADNNHKALESAGLHRDELYLEITRQYKRGEKTFTYLVKVEVGLDNSARMCK